MATRPPETMKDVDDSLHNIYWILEYLIGRVKTLQLMVLVLTASLFVSVALLAAAIVK